MMITRSTAYSKLFECVVATHINMVFVCFSSVFFFKFENKRHDIESIKSCNHMKKMKYTIKTRSKENARAFYFEQRVIKRSTHEKRIVFFI